jgi:hypothetical protein
VISTYDGSASTLKVNGPANPVQSTSTLASTLTVESSGSSLSDQRPLIQNVTNIPAKTISFTVHTVDGIGPFSKDASGAYSKSLVFQWPSKPPNSHWATGETIQTDMVSVRFFLHVKV